MAIYSLPKLCNDFFGPLPPQPIAAPAAPRPAKDCQDIILAHFTTLNGAWDVFRIVEYVLSFLKHISLCTPGKEGFAYAASVMNKAGIALSVPRLIGDVHGFKNSVDHIRNMSENPQAAHHSQMIAQAYKGGVVNAMNIVNDTAQAVQFLHKVGIAPLGKYLCVAEGFDNASSLINDTIELVSRVFHLHRSYTEDAPASEDAARELQENINLSWLIVAKDVPSIVGCVIAVATLFFASLQTPIVAMISLGLSTMWLTMKLTSTFYEKIFIENHQHRRV